MVKVVKMIMQGFKSFAGKVEVPFPKGFTIVCGPNGSGKSNVIDAITFVLGVTSARAIRAKKLEKLIFNGAKTKSPAKFCEVTMVLDNSDNQIPGLGEEVTIIRRVNRSGVSLYKINGKTVNKTKVIDTFAYANLSPDGYNIILQGDVTRIIEMSPKQRREVVDDISGITEFNDKKEEALKKLEKVESRVRESMIVIIEKQKRVEQLKREKEAAERYQQLNDELRKASASSIKYQIDKNENELKGLEEKYKALKKEFEEISKELKKYEDSIELKEKKFKHKSDEIIEKRSFDTERELEKTSSEILRKRDKINSIERELKYLSKTDRDVSKHLPIKSQKLLSVLSVPDKYTTAIEVSIGSHADDIIVDTESQASECIEFLKSNKMGRARFLPLDRMRSRRIYDQIDKKGFVGVAIDLVKYDMKFDPAVQYVLGNTLIFDNLDNARKVRGYRIVTLDGELLEKSGAIIGGYREKKKSVFESDKLRQEKEKLVSEIESLVEHMEILRAKKEGEDKKFIEIKEEKTELDKELEDLKIKSKEYMKKKFQIQDELGRNRVEQTKIDTLLDDLKKKFKEFKDVSEFADVDIEQLQKKISYCISEIRKLGPVNIRAIEEYNSISVEFEQMKKKLDGLIEEKNSVIKTIEDIETRRQEKFMNTLNELKKNFTEIYYDMVKGVGNLRLEEENNIDSGLVIEASPEGKRVVDMDLMSGGEKTMASLSFLFAILQHYASPFYVLDEVDAALDKVNTQRVADYVRKYSKKVQFIAISHDDITIAAADKVFGVANQDGVSRIYGLDMPKR